MTDQVLDTIFHCGEQYLLSDEPLSQYMNLPEFMPISTANHRGYTAVWAIVGECLFLVSLSGCVVGINRNGLDLVFPNVQTPVLASWYSGELRLLSGRLVSSSDAEPLYEHETVLSIVRGHVTASRSVSRKYTPIRLFDPILLQPVHIVGELDTIVLDKLNAAGVLRLGDLIRFGEAELMKATGLDVDSVIKLNDVLAGFGLVLGSRVDDWPP